jgi:antitoxin component HigA of HigAB toxin-antitoxin module
MSLIERLTSTPEDKRLFEQERVIFDVTELISKLMEEQGVTKAELARRLNTSKANITQMLDGRRNMTLRSITDAMFHLDASLNISTRSLACNEGWQQQPTVCYVLVPRDESPNQNWKFSSNDRPTSQPVWNMASYTNRQVG